MSTTPRRDPIDLTVIGGFLRRRQDDAAQRAPARRRAITARGDARAADGTGDRLSHPHKSGPKLVRRAHLDCAAAADWTCAPRPRGSAMSYYCSECDVNWWPYQTDHGHCPSCG